MRRTVTVTGFGEASAPPDLAVVQLGAECVARHAPEALKDASAVVARMRALAVGGGVAAADLASSGAQLWPDHDHEGRPSGYRATLALTVRIRDLAAATDLIPALLAAGADAGRLHATDLEHSDRAALAATARENAFADARARAEQYAALAGASLGEVLAVAEGSPTGGPSSVLARHHAMSLASSMPVEPGTATVAAAVTVRWGLG